MDVDSVINILNRGGIPILHIKDKSLRRFPDFRVVCYFRSFFILISIPDTKEYRWKCATRSVLRRENPLESQR